MRKRTVCALMMTLCLLAACGGEAGTGNNTDELALDIRADYLSCLLYTSEKRRLAFEGIYQVNAELMKAAHPGAMVQHLSLIHI